MPRHSNEQSEARALFHHARQLYAFISHDGPQVLCKVPQPEGDMICPVRSPMVRDWLVASWLECQKPLPREESIRTAMRGLEALAHRNSLPRRLVFHRVAAYGERVGMAVDLVRIVIDLCNSENDVVAIDGFGWEVSEGFPHCFTSDRNMKPLPRPSHPIQSTGTDTQRTSALTAFRRLLNPASDKDWHRMLIWLLMAMRGIGPFPALSLEGPPASGKTTAASLLRHVVDPTHAYFVDPTLPPRQQIDHARRNWIVAFDALQHPNRRLANFINSLLTGVGIELREHRDHHIPTTIDLQRPVLLTSQVEDTAQHPIAHASRSLAARTLTAQLAPLAENSLPVDHIWSQFNRLLPDLLASLFTALATALRDISATRPNRISRLPDAARWAIAASPALGLTEEHILTALEPDHAPDPNIAFINQISRFMSDRDSWQGTASELLDLLPPEDTPESPRALAALLRRCSSGLTEHGQRVGFKRVKGTRLITLTKIERGAAKSNEFAALDENSPISDSTTSFDSTISPQSNHFLNETENFGILRH